MSPTTEGSSSPAICCRHSLRRSSEGFTLFELLVVIIIIGLLLTMAVLGVGNNQAAETKKSVARLAALTDLAKQQALFNGEDLSLSFWRNGYAFHRLESDSNWVVMTDDEQLAPRTFRDEIEVALLLEGLEVELEVTAKHKPQIFILSSGEMSPFETIINDDQDNAFRFTADNFGNLNVENVER